MDSFYSRRMKLPANGEDVFGEHFAAREIIYDPQNKQLFLTMLSNYLEWQIQNGRLNPQFHDDLKRLRGYQVVPYLSGACGVLFAGTVWNPNFVKRRSYYMRKFAIFGWGLLGFNLGVRYLEDHITCTMLRMNDYLPLEIKRALQDKDFRHIALLNEEDVSKSRFDPATGKSLS